MTVDDIVVSFDLKRQKHFNYGQIYVALSRARSLQGLHVTGQLEKKHVRANPKVHAEYHRLRQEAMSVSSGFTTSDIHVCPLNICSLRKYVVDTMYDANLTRCDILALTETQLLPHHSVLSQKYYTPILCIDKITLLINIQV